MLTRSLLVAGLLVSVQACNDSPGGPGPRGIDPKTRPAAIVVEPANPTLVAADTLRFRATVTDGYGKIIDGATVAWSSSDSTRLQIGANGLAKVLIEPTTTEAPVTVTATLENASGRTDVKLKWQLLDIFPDTNVLFTGMTRTLRARLVNSWTGNPNPDMSDITIGTWESTDPAVATVDATGLVTAKAVGHVQIRGSLASGRTTTAELYVKAAPSLRFVDAAGAYGTFITLTESIFGPDLAPHGCGLTDTGEVYCWGVALDAAGPTDRCERTYRFSPGGLRSLKRFRCSETPYRLASPVSFTSLSARGDMGCGVATNRKIYCWGRTGTALGTGVTDTSYHGVSAIASNDDFISVHVPEVSALNAYTPAPTCGLRTDRILVCWGASFGATPTAVGTTTWRAISGSGRCGIASDTTAYCLASAGLQRWGTSRWATIAAQQSRVCVTDVAGQPACGSANFQNSFLPVANMPPLVSVATYMEGSSVFAYECGLTSSGDMYCLTGPAPVLGKIDLGVQLKRFFGNCGMGVDDKAYCWLVAPATGAVTFRRIPGQP